MRSTGKRLFCVITAAGWESNEDSNSLSFFKKLCEQTTRRHHHQSLEQVQLSTAALSLPSTPPRDATASRGMGNAGGCCGGGRGSARVSTALPGGPQPLTGWPAPSAQRPALSGPLLSHLGSGRVGIGSGLSELPGLEAGPEAWVCLLVAWFAKCPWDSVLVESVPRAPQGAGLLPS